MDGWMDGWIHAHMHACTDDFTFSISMLIRIRPHSQCSVLEDAWGRQKTVVLTDRCEKIE